MDGQPAGEGPRLGPPPRSRPLAALGAAGAGLGLLLLLLHGLGCPRWGGSRGASVGADSQAVASRVTAARSAAVWPPWQGRREPGWEGEASKPGLGGVWLGGCVCVGAWCGVV